MTWKYNLTFIITKRFSEWRAITSNRCRRHQCCKAASKGFTPSDFPTVTFNQQQLDKLISKVGKARL